MIHFIVAAGIGAAILAAGQAIVAKIQAGNSWH